MKIKQNLDQILEKLVIVEMILAFMVHVFRVLLHNSELSSASFLLSYVVLVILTVVFSCRHKFSLPIVLLTMCAMISVIVNLLIEQSAELNFHTLDKLIFFITTNLFFYIVLKIKISESAMKAAIFLPVLLAFIDIVSYYLLGNHEMYSHGITLGFQNPNQTASWLIVLMSFCVIAFLRSSNWFNKFMMLFFIVLLIPILMMTKARASMLSFLVFVVLVCVGGLKRNYKIGWINAVLIASVPLIFAVVYLSVIDTPLLDHFQFLVSKGKSLTSRVSVWKTGFDAFEKSPLFGSYYEIISGKYQQLHNVGVDCIAKYGGITYIVFVVLTASFVHKSSCRITDLKQYAGICAFIMIIVLGVFEAGLYSGYGGLNYMIGGFLLVTRRTSETNPRKILTKGA